MPLASTHDNSWFLALYDRHVDTVYRVCRTQLGNNSDAEDAVQDVFLKILAKAQNFENDEHERAWLIRVAINHCRDIFKSSWNKRTNLESIAEPAAIGANPAESHDETLEVVMSLPENLRACVLLYYYEGYKTAEIAEMLQKPNSTVRNYLADARKVLREKLGGGFDE